MRSQTTALKVKDLMTPSVVSISPVESVEDAARVMTRFYHRDGFENYILNQISNKIGDLYLRFRFYEVDGMEVCRVTVQSSQEPAFISKKGKQHFYMRTGNGSRPFEISDATKYMIDRWPDILV